LEKREGELWPFKERKTSASGRAGQVTEREELIAKPDRYQKEEEG